MKSQWEYFLQNLGEWHGSFTKISPQGEILQDTASVLRLEGSNHNQEVCLTLQRVGKPDTVLRFQSVGGGGLIFFPGGDFSQGSLQFAPYTQFGAELALIDRVGKEVPGNRRLRLVELFNSTSQLDEITLIREKRSDTEAPERPPLTLADLLGEWQGEAVTLYPDWRSPDTYTTHLSLHLEAEDCLVQCLCFGAGDAGHKITSKALVNGNLLRFSQGTQTVQVLLLPDGASATCPTQIISGQPFFLEAGWLLQPDLRQRMIRSYNDKGEWVSLTLVTERKVSDP